MTQKKSKKLAPAKINPGKPATSAKATPSSKTPAKATPSNARAKKKAKSSDQENKLTLSDKINDCPDKDTIGKFVDALYRVHEAKQKKKLFEDEGSKVHVQVNGIKLPKDGRRQLLRVTMPYCVVPDPVDVCLIVKDLQKGLKVDHEPTVNHFLELLADKGVTNVTKVMSLRELKVEYKPYEAKLSMSKQYDVILADDRIIRLLPKFLGKHFYLRKRFPIQVDLRSSDLKKEINKAIKTVTLPLSHHGTTATVCVGNSQMKKDDLVENLLQLNSVLSLRYPGGWRNIRSLNMKTENSPAVPFYVNTGSGNELGFVDSDVPKKIKQQTVSGELSLHPGTTVTVLPSGKVKVKRHKDPEWDFKNDPENEEKFVDGSDEEEETEKDKTPKKRKVTEEKLEGKNKKMKKEEVSSEDEDAERAEQSYLKRKTDDADEGEESKYDDQNKDDEADPDESDNEEESSENEEAESEAEGEGEEMESGSDTAQEDEEEEEGEEESDSGGESDDYDDLQPLDEKDIICDDDDDDEGKLDKENDMDDLLLQNQGADGDEEEVVKKKPKVLKKTKNMKRKERQEAAKAKKNPKTMPSKGPKVRPTNRPCKPNKSGKTGIKGRK